jgi:hypothetical protein
MPSPVPVDLSALAGVVGVKGYIVVDAHGRPLVQMKESASSRFTQALVQWGRQCAKVGKGFRYLAFTRKNGEQLVMFRVGPNFLGVTLSNQPEAKNTLEEIVTIINRLSPGVRRQSNVNGKNETEVSP